MERAEIVANKATMMSLVLQADMMVKIIMLILLIFSIWSWTIIFDKMFKFRLLSFRGNKFEKLFWSGISLEAVFDKIKGKVNHPYIFVFHNVMNEWRNSMESFDKKSDYAKNSLKERISVIIDSSINKSVHKLGSELNLLAIISSSSPFIGLFGTVWGIMSSFQSISVTKNTSLAIVAPGIAEALLATAIGLFTAIPAVIFYNINKSVITSFTEKLENFSADLYNILSREIERD